MGPGDCQRHHGELLSLFVRSAVECWMVNRENQGSNTLGCGFESFSFYPRHPSSLSCSDEYLAIDSDGNVSE